MTPSNLPPGVSNADIEEQAGAAAARYKIIDPLLAVGGPVFPQRIDSAHGGSTTYFGLSMRQFFMAHAPAEPQAWFMPTMDAECPAVPSSSSIYLTDEQRADLHDEARNSEGSQWAKEWWAYRDVQEQRQELWQAEFRKQRLVQWPAAWADEQLKQSQL